MRPRTLIAGAIFLIVAVCSGIRIYRLMHFREWLATVTPGDDVAAVWRKMGEPDKIQRRPDPLWCNSPRCEFSYMYGHTTPPEWWVVGFDRQGRVVETAELQSP